MAGRQREFDKQQALNNAMRVFWKKGYVGSSLADLTGAMGINKPSMYAAFGNKEQLFVQATEHYIEHYAKKHMTFLHQNDIPLDQRVKNYMLSALKSQCDKTNPKGCYISLCVSESASDDLPEAAEAMIEEAWTYNERYLKEFFEQEKVGDQLDNQADSTALALFIITILHGTASLARGGKSFEDLAPMIERATSTIV